MSYIYMYIYIYIYLKCQLSMCYLKYMKKKHNLFKITNIICQSMSSRPGIIKRPANYKK